MWIVDDAVLEIVNTGPREVAVAAWIVLCDRAQFKIIDSAFRWALDYSFQYSIWAAGQSHIYFSGANITTVSYAVSAQDPNAHGHFGLFWIRSDASLVVEKSARAGYGLSGGRQMGDDAWEIAAMENGRVNVTDVQMFTEWYAANRAKVSIHNSKCNHDKALTLA